MNYVVVLNHNDQPTDLNGVTAGKYGVLVSNGKTYLHPAVSDTTAAAAVAAPADTGKDVSKAGSTVQIAGGDAIAVPARSALLLGPTAVMSEPDNPDNPNNPDNPDNSDQPDKPSGDNAHNWRQQCGQWCEQRVSLTWRYGVHWLVDCSHHCDGHCAAHRRLRHVTQDSLSP